MSEIAKCPICGGEPYFSIHTSSMGCCGMYYQALKRVDIEKGWNKLAAAMELAKKEVKFENCSPEDEYKYQDVVAWARERVLEVFK